MIPEETATRKVEPTAEGVRVELRAPFAAVIGKTISQTIVVALAAWLLRAILLSLQNLSSGDPLVWPFSLLQRFELPSGTTRWILYACAIAFGYTAIAGSIAILMRLTRRDSILIQPGQWIVERRALGFPRRNTIELHEKVALEFDAFDSALLARMPTRKVTISNLGTDEDRHWLKEQLDRRGTVTSLQNIATGAARVIRTIRLEKRSDGSLLVADTKASRFGCPIILTVVVIGLIAASLRFEGAGWWPVTSFLAVVAVLMWISTNQRREATVNRGSIHSVSVNSFNRLQGKGSRLEQVIRSSILYLQTRGPNTMDLRTIDLEDYPSEVNLATLTGANAGSDAQTVLEAISEASGFPILTNEDAAEWKEKKIEEFVALELAEEERDLDEDSDDEEPRGPQVP